MSKKELKQIQKWDMFEFEINGEETGNPYVEVKLEAVFTNKNRTIIVDGFYDGNGSYKIRCMPDVEGIWTFNTSSNKSELNNITGKFECIAPQKGNHGPVRIGERYHFVYEDGYSYFPIGTTCYAWNHQGQELESQTLETLKNSPFNKIRMCIFPKSYLYNENEPEFYVYEGSLEKGWNYKKFNPDYFKHLEKLIMELMNLGIESDLILFHPYDRWGFSNMRNDEDDLYIKYIVARLSSFRNIWWSLANEYDLMPSKNMNDWDRFFRIIQTEDPYNHLRSIHNCRKMYDFTKNWTTHCSIQHNDVSLVTEWRKLYEKPVVIDECKYEGNIHSRWGNINGQEMVNRFWEGYARGGYVGHGETFYHSKDILWWAKGGILYGQSPERIEFLRKIIYEGPETGIDKANLGRSAHAVAGKGEDYFIVYYGIGQPIYQILDLPKGNKYKIEIIDAWNMTIKSLNEEFEGTCRVELPGKQYIALRIKKLNTDLPK